MSKLTEWSQFRDHAAGGQTVAEALSKTPFGEAFCHQLEQFEVRASQHERITVKWWHAPYVYVEVTDGRRSYPASTRALISFDLTNGKWASHSSGNRNVLARRGWRTFLDILADCSVPLSGDESACESATATAAAG